MSSWCSWHILANVCKCVHTFVCTKYTEPESKGEKDRLKTQTEREGGEARGGNINLELMVQVKAHLGNRWPKLNFLFLPIESELTGIPVHPQLHSAGRRGLDCCVNFDLDLQVLQLILTPYRNALTQKIRVFKLPEKTTAKRKLKRERGHIKYTIWGGVHNHIDKPLTLLNWSQFKMFRKSSFLNGEYVFMTFFAHCQWSLHTCS